MPKGDQYIGLKNFLQSIKQERLEVSFEEIENILKFELPDSARKHPPWWSNSLSHSQAHSWLNAGYEIESPSDAVSNEKVVFIKKTF